MAQRPTGVDMCNLKKTGPHRLLVEITLRTTNPTVTKIDIQGDINPVIKQV